MKAKTNEEMLKSIKQYNKTAREDKAKLEGFITANHMIDYLNEEINSGRGQEIFQRQTAKATDKKVSTAKKAPEAHVVKAATKPAKSKVLPVIHIVDVLDRSGSMSGGKIKAAASGINTGVKQLIKDTASVKYTYTLCDFSDDVIFKHKAVDLSIVESIGVSTRNSTALYDAIGKSIEVIKSSMGATDKVLMNIYTDGQENSSKFFRAGTIASLIKELSEVGWTFTFIGTDADVRYAQKNLHFDDSNTLVHDNTAAGMAAAFTTNSVSRSAYSSKVERGIDVSKGFYKDID